MVLENLYLITERTYPVHFNPWIRALLIFRYLAVTVLPNVPFECYQFWPQIKMLYGYIVLELIEWKICWIITHFHWSVINFQLPCDRPHLTIENESRAKTNVLIDDFDNWRYSFFLPFIETMSMYINTNLIIIIWQDFMVHHSPTSIFTQRILCEQRYVINADKIAHSKINIDIKYSKRCQYCDWYLFVIWGHKSRCELIAEHMNDSEWKWLLLKLKRRCRVILYISEWAHTTKCATIQRFSLCSFHVEV